jgi:hypothetical protein
MKKVLILLLLITVSFSMRTFEVNAQFRFTQRDQTTVVIDDIRHTRIVGRIEYNGVESRQVINYMGANIKTFDNINIVVGDNYQSHGWGMGNIPIMIDRIHANYPNFKVVGAVNGDFYNTTTGMPVNAHIRDFEVIFSGVVSNRPIVGFKDNGEVVHGIPCFTNYQLIVYDEDGAFKQEMPVARINGLPYGLDDISVFFDDFAFQISSDYQKVVINATETKKDGFSTRYFGKGHLNYQTTDNIEVPSQGFVIVGHDFNLNDLITETDRVVVQQKPSCGFEGVRFAIGVWEHLVNEGVPTTHLTAGAGFNLRHPRTAIGIKEDGTVFFVVVDGRNTPLDMDGVTAYEMAEIMSFFGAYHAYNLDGGGSSTFVMLNEEEGYDVINTPSDGRLRSVSNGLFFVKGYHAPILDPVPFPETREALMTPSSIYLDGSGHIRFDGVTNSVGYRISINGIETEIENTSHYLDLPPGIYQIKVRAIADRVNYRHSDYSEEVTIVIYTQEIQQMLELFRGYIKR